MEDKLLCKFNLFTIDQDIYLYSGANNKVNKIGSCGLDNISDMLAGLLVNRHISNLELSGNQDYAAKTAKEILTKNNYDLRNVRIYINGKVFN